MKKTVILNKILYLIILVFLIVQITAVMILFGLRLDPASRKKRSGQHAY